MTHTPITKAPFNFVSEHFIMLEDICDINIPQPNNKWTFIIVCKEGNIEIRLNGNVFQLHPNEVLLCTSTSTMEKHTADAAFKGDIIGLSKQFAKEIFPNSAKLWRQVFYMELVRKVAIPESAIKELEYDYEYLKRRIVPDGNDYYLDIIRCIAQVFIYRISHVLERAIGDVEAPESMLSGEYLARAFFDLLANTTPKQRSVNWYADRLHRTPKYLSAAVKKVSGKTPLVWIQGAAVNEVAHYLKDTSMSIKDICDHLQFSSLTFFGRFVRTHLGCSPREYRKMRSGKESATEGNA